MILPFVRTWPGPVVGKRKALAHISLANGKGRARIAGRVQSERRRAPPPRQGNFISMKDMVTPWPLVGRDRELASFAAAWASCHCRGVVVCGPAGIGKTRLAEECLARAVQAGFTGGRATASAVAAAVPLGAIAHLIPRGLDLSDPVAGFAAGGEDQHGQDQRRGGELCLRPAHARPEPYDPGAGEDVRSRAPVPDRLGRAGLSSLRTRPGAQLAQRHQPGACGKARPGRALAARAGTCPSALVTRAGAELRSVADQACLPLG